MDTEARIWLLSLAIAAAFAAARLYAQGLRWRWGRGWYLQLAAILAVAGVGAAGYQPPLAAVVGWAGLLVPNLVAQRLMTRLNQAVWGFDLPRARRLLGWLRFAAHAPSRALAAAKVEALALALDGQHAAAEVPLLAFETPDLPAPLRRAAQATRLFVRLHADDLAGLADLALELEPPPGPASAEVAGLATRACLETGRWDEALGWLDRLRGDELAPASVALVAVPVFALLGAEEDLESAFSRIEERMVPAHMRDYWRARARAVDGDVAGARTLLQRSLAAIPAEQTVGRQRVAGVLAALDASTDLDAADGSSQASQGEARPLGTRAERDRVLAGARAAIARAGRGAELVRGGRGGLATWLPRALALGVTAPSLAVLAGLEGWAPALGPWAERTWLAWQLDRHVQMDGEYARLVTHMGLHAHLTHLALNVLALVWLGSRTTRLYGPGATVVVFFVGGVTGGVVHLMLSRTPAVGASGGVLALLGLLAVGWVRARGLISDRQRRRLLIEMAAVIGLQLVFDQFVPQVAAAAHAGGLAAGMLLGAVWPLGARKAAERAEAADEPAPRAA